jgi:hypothetical protein
MVGPSGLEPPTSRLSGVRSNQLSYGPKSWASMGGQACWADHSLPHPELAKPLVSSDTKEPQRHKADPRLQLHAPEQEIRIAHGLESPEV